MALDKLWYGTYFLHILDINFKYQRETKTENSNLNYCVVIYKPKITATVHEIRAVRRVVTDAALTRIQLIVNNGHLEKSRILSDSQTKDRCLEGR